MHSKDTFGFGNKPSMKEVPPGQTAIFSFRGEGEIIDTEYGNKYSFPITLISHSSYPLLADGPMQMQWDTNCGSAKQLYNGLYKHGTIDESIQDDTFHKKLKKHFKNTTWILTRFDTGAYWLEIQQ